MDFIMRRTHSDLFLARVEECPGVVGCGRTISEAVMDLVCNISDGELRERGFRSVLGDGPPPFSVLSFFFTYAPEPQKSEAHKIIEAQVKKF